MNNNLMRHARLGSCLFVLVLTAGLVFAGGCWDKKDLEDQAFVQALGIDKAAGGIAVTAMIAVPRNLATGGGGGGAGGGGETSFVTTVQGPDVISALALMNIYVDRKINLMHNKVIVLGKDLALDGVGRSLSSLVRYREVRRTVSVIVTETTAAEFLRSYRPILESNAAKWFEIITQSYTESGLIPSSQFHLFMLAMESTSRQPAAILAGVRKPGVKAGKQNSAAKKQIPDYLPGQTPREGGEPVELLGTAVFKGDKMVGRLTGSETRILNLLRGDFRRAVYSFADPVVRGASVPLEIKQGSLPVVTVSDNGDIPVVRIRLSLEGDILGIESREDYGIDIRKTGLLEAEVREGMRSEAERLIKKTQALDADIVGIGTYARKRFLTWRQWMEYDWPHRFRRASVNVDVVFSIRRIGLQINQPKLPR